MRAELANLYDCAVPFLSHAAVNLSWYDIKVTTNIYMTYQYVNIYIFIIYILVCHINIGSNLNIVPTQVDSVSNLHILTITNLN